MNRLKYGVEPHLMTRLEAVVCDACGAEFNGDEIDSVNHFATTGGYFSVFPSDMVTLQVDVCGPCLEAWVNTFKNQNVFREQVVPTPWEGEVVPDDLDFGVSVDQFRVISDAVYHVRSRHGSSVGYFYDVMELPSGQRKYISAQRWESFHSLPWKP